MCPPPVATTAWRSGSSSSSTWRSTLAEIRLAFAREDVGDRAVLARLDALVDVFRAPAEPRAERPRDAWSCRRP